MDEHVHAWLEAYLDGELKGQHLQQVEDHLVYCQECRMEMEKLRALSALLKESPAPGILTSPERFVAQVGLRLPRQQKGASNHTTLRIGWQMVPLTLFAAWAFVQVLFTIIGLMVLGLNLGLGNLIGQMALGTLDRNALLVWSIGLNFGFSVVIGLLYVSWLASWWAGLQHGQAET
jgi:anti-sigma factor RsiW